MIIPLPKNTAISSLNDYRPVALTPAIMKYSERLFLQHIKASLPPTFCPHQSAYRAYRSTDDTIATALHTALSHLEHQGNYVMLFKDFSFTFNMVIPGRQVTKLSDLGISQPIRNSEEFIINFRKHGIDSDPLYISGVMEDPDTIYINGNRVDPDPLYINWDSVLNYNQQNSPDLETISAPPTQLLSAPAMALIWRPSPLHPPNYSQLQPWP
ncbi:hypothetical protein P4O66_000280 [Electrophorus voltai]|uniref:Reverse transcriptase domain-containing protein n=1 Tax=Electrophorus voltai TaxID=2609070 RepID=A0AAD8ZIU2_9TELE|nr:hypothetical protein P4O66_000280 [Electrophorus voltai]